ncbi:Rubredoxin [uncultured archaeon]|nr:Rubredoxin [uncultured archaeon]
MSKSWNSRISKLSNQMTVAKGSKSSRLRSKLSNPERLANHALRQAFKAKLRNGSKWMCTVCGIYQYDSDLGDQLAGVLPGTEPQDFPDSWSCPICKAGKDKLEEIPEEDFR